MPHQLEIVIAILGAAAVVIQTLGLIILADLRYRIVRLENYIFKVGE